MTQPYLQQNLAVVTSPNKAIDEARSILESDWLYTIDFEALLAAVFACVRDCYVSNPSSFVMEWVKFVLDTNTVVTPMQKDVIESTIKKLTIELKQHLEMMGILNHEYRPRIQFVKILQDSSLQLKLTDPSNNTIQISRRVPFRTNSGILHRYSSRGLV